MVQNVLYQLRLIFSKEADFENLLYLIIMQLMSRGLLERTGEWAKRNKRAMTFGLIAVASLCSTFDQISNNIETVSKKLGEGISDLEAPEMPFVAITQYESTVRLGIVFYSGYGDKVFCDNGLPPVREELRRKEYFVRISPGSMKTDIDESYTGGLPCAPQKRY